MNSDLKHMMRVLFSKNEPCVGDVLSERGEILDMGGYRGKWHQFFKYLMSFLGFGSEYIDYQGRVEFEFWRFGTRTNKYLIRVYRTLKFFPITFKVKKR